ncbi:MAG: hypothetical protein OEY34_02130, partial [Cyclobacteriaceae bacterium]|nr:hypothetical protein [Cyclobacteriaceae bacterium]
MGMFNKGVSFFLILLSLGLANSASAQRGNFFTTKFVIEADRIDNPYFSVKQAPGGLVYIANRSGILSYDGLRWTRIPAPGAVYSIDISEDNTVFAGGKSGFGYVNHQNEYKEISNKGQGAENIVKVKLLNDNVYFLNPSKIFIVSIDEKKLISTIVPPGGVPFLNIFQFQGKIIITDENLASFELTSKNVLVPYDLNLEINSDLIFIKSEKGGDKYIAGTSDNKLFTITEKGAELVHVKDEGYLQNADITDAVWMNDTLLAVGTLKGGVVFINPQTGKLEQIINNFTGITDNEILSLEKDLDNGLWVAQHGGLDRVAPFLPITNFTNYPGLSGKPVSVYDFGGNLYVSTSLGLYILNDIKKYQENIQLIKKKITLSEEKDKEEASTTQEKEGSDSGVKFFRFLRKKNKEEEQKQGLLGRIFSNKEKRESVQRDSTYFEERVIRELQSISHRFEKVKGISTKSDLFEEYEGRLISGGLAGLFEIQKDSSIRIIDEPVRSMRYSAIFNALMVSTYDNQVRFFKIRNRKWEETRRIVDLDDPILFMYEDNDSTIWYSGIDAAYRITVKSEEINLESFELENPYSDQTVILRVNEKVYFVNPNGYFYFDDLQSDFIRDTVLQKEYGLPKKYLFSGSDYLWIYNGTDWHEMGAGGVYEIPFLGIIKDLSFAWWDNQKEVYWAINSGGELFKLSPEATLLNSNYGLLLKQMRTQSSMFNPTSGTVIKILEEQGPLLFEYVQPDFSGVMGLRYRYKLNGLENEWSPWQSENIFRFPYLPPGDYTILVETKDIFGQINKSPEVRFKIIPPYWQQAWFYALEIIIFGLLLLLSIRLNRSKGRYFIFNRMLAFLTLILFVEFIQAIAEAEFRTDSSPVFNFFIQVGVATVILPFESLLRRWMFKEKPGTIST